MTQLRDTLPKSARSFAPAFYQEAPVYGKVDGLWWRATGEGRPLVLAMGHGYPAAMFHRLVPLLEPHFRVIVFDNRGIANSVDAGGLDGLTITGMAADVALIIDEAAGGKADVLGVSLGGIVAQELAISMPRMVDRLILACTHTADSNVVLAGDDVLEMMQNRAALDDEEALRASQQYVYAPRTPQKLIDEDMAVRRAFHHGWAGYQAQLRASMHFMGTSARLPRVQSETLVIHGNLDRLVPPGNAKVIADRIPNAELVLLAGVSHNFYCEKPEKAAEVIIPFLQQPRTEQTIQTAAVDIPVDIEPTRTRSPRTAAIAKKAKTRGATKTRTTRGSASQDSIATKPAKDSA